MDQRKTGRFIAEQRKRQGRTQRQLAETLGISDKTVSKWETGNGFPEVSLLLPLCRALEVSVNELLTGEHVPEQEYRRKAEDNMAELVREAQKNRKKLVLAFAVAALTVTAAVPMFVVAGTAALALWQRVMLVAALPAVMAGGIAIACILDRDAGAFQCPACGTRFVPTMAAYVMGPHTPWKRKLRCPNCGEVRYCRHVMEK